MTKLDETSKTMDRSVIEPLVEYFPGCRPVEFDIGSSVTSSASIDDKRVKLMSVDPGGRWVIGARGRL